jgi:hypothetical protein
MNITVTLLHIAAGTPRDSDHCPVALALSEATNRPCRVGKTFWFYDDEKCDIGHSQALPTSVVIWIHDFDKGFKQLEPITFETNI